METSSSLVVRDSCNETGRDEKFLSCSNDLSEKSSDALDVPTCPVPVQQQQQEQHPESGNQAKVENGSPPRVENAAGPAHDDDDKAGEVSCRRTEENASNCSFCERERTERFCVDCSRNYCRFCLRVHSELPFGDGHRLQPVSGAGGKPEGPEDLHPLCKDHLERMELACEDCSILLCIYCLLSKHRGHRAEYASEFLASTREKLERDFKVRREGLHVVTSSRERAESSSLAAEEKARGIIGQIKSRGESVKQVIDSAVAVMTGEVEEELDRYKRAVEDFTTKSKGMELRMTEGMAAVARKLEELSYDNVGECHSRREESFEVTPQFRKMFLVSLKAGIGVGSLNLEELIGRVRKEPRLEMVTEETVELDQSTGSVARANRIVVSFGTKVSKTSTLSRHGKIICSVFKDALRIEIVQFFGTNQIQAFDCGHRFSDVYHSLTINGRLYIAARSSHSGGNHLIAMNDVAFGELCPEKFSSHTFQGETFRLSKSHDGNILVTLENKLVHLDEIGHTVKTIALEFEVSDAVQLDEGRYVVCRNGVVSVVDGAGQVALDYLPSGSVDEMESPLFVTKDAHGCVYVADDASKSIFALNAGLGFLSRRSIGERICNVCYSEERDVLMVETDDKLLSFRL